MLKEADANVVLFNVGGIVANYPTDLLYHYRNPFMQGDLTAEVVKRLHAEAIRVKTTSSPTLECELTDISQKTLGERGKDSAPKP